MTGTKQTTGANPGNGATLSATATCPAGKLLVRWRRSGHDDRGERASRLAAVVPELDDRVDGGRRRHNTLAGGNTMSVQAFALCM